MRHEQKGRDRGCHVGGGAGEHLVDVEHSERVERNLDRLITKRHDQRRMSEGDRRAQDLWAESVRRYNARQQQDHRLAWYEYEMRLYRIHSGLASEHLRRAEKLENGHTEENECTPNGNSSS
jgi:hypothetical protein